MRRLGVVGKANPSKPDANSDAPWRDEHFRPFKHPTKPGRVTVPHPKSEVPKGTLYNILNKPASIEAGNTSQVTARCVTRTA